MTNRFLFLFAFSVMTAGLCHGQAFEAEPHWNADRRDNFFVHGEINKWDEQGYPVGWDDVSAFEAGFAISKKDYT